MPYTTEGTGYQPTDTSHAAAKSAGASSTIYRIKVLEALRERGAMTGDELAEALAISILTIRPRLTELSRSGLIEDSGREA